ncbi:MAG: hypothetical protein R3185_08940, partial [Candidatus Thermoplasmatota archaeon]|nr:hypothetical protein [Candidatus Thermoplasmatota archaeon]
MNTKPLLVTIGALLLLAWVPAGLAQDAGTVTGTITAKESGCPDGKFYCWGVSLDGEITPGATVELEVVNPASNRETHNLYLKYDASYNGETTDGESADENTADLSPGD